MTTIDGVPAVRRASHGVLEIDRVDVEAGPDDALVKVAWAAVNPFDLQVLRGDFGDADKPRTLGAVGTGWRDGVPVLVSGHGLGVNRDGTWSEWVAAPKAAVHELPDGADLSSAATVGIAGKTAWRAIHELASVTQDDRVLVMGATGGVGSHAIQLAAGLGATTWGQTASRVKAARLARLGAIPIMAETPAQLADQVDTLNLSVVLDPLGGDWTATLLSAVTPRARIVSYGTLAGDRADVDLRMLYGRGLSILGMSGATATPEASMDALKGSLDAVANGDVVADVEALPLGEGLDVPAVMAARRVEGTLLLDPIRDERATP